MIASAEKLRVLSLIPGRIRLHAPGWSGEDRERIENRLRRINEVRNAEANPLTGNVLVHFDHRATDSDSFMAKLNDVLGEPSREESACDDEPNTDAPVEAGRSLFRIGVRGLLGHAVVDSLWFGAGFLGSAMGLPLAGLGPLHVLMDLVVWTMAFTGEHKIHLPRTASLSPEPLRSDNALASLDEGRILSGCTT